MDRRLIGLLVITLLLPVSAAGQTAARQESPRAPLPPHNGGLTPFRGLRIGGTTIDGLALNQVECPLRVEAMTISRDATGVAVALRVGNVSERAVERSVILAWVAAPDGTLRGRQEVPRRGAIAAGATESVEFRLRTVTAQPSDAIIVAVQDATGGSQQWRRDQSLLEEDVKNAVRTRK
jgi:hypothetical protein